MSNPLFPLNEYVPDGEPHVFGGRVYLYGSHDRENGDRFCMEDYTVYSAPVEDLTDWTCHGVSYRKSQDPRSRAGKPVDLYAPDCVRGPDGRYYLYYAAMGPNVKPFGPMSVAVADAPEGPFEYLADIQYPDGSPVLKYLTNDPAVINDEGRIYLYYGWGLGRDFRSRWLAPLYTLVQSRLFHRPLREIRDTEPSILSCAVAELSENMYTVRSGPKAVLDSRTTADRNSPLYRHAFYEAPSIRKFNGLYYLVYSTNENCELAYATSRYPDRDFTYRGVIISNADLGYQGSSQYHMSAGTIHGGIEYINGEYYIFYHRCTNNTDFSRQACAERIVIDEAGEIRQVEVTTQGTEAHALEAARLWQAAECCNLYNSRTSRVMGNGHSRDLPSIVSEGGESYITAIDHGTIIGYKYLAFRNISRLSVTCRGGGGPLYLATDETAAQEIAAGRTEHAAGRLELSEGEGWHTETVQLALKDSSSAPLYFIYMGKGKTDLKEFRFDQSLSV